MHVLVLSLVFPPDNVSTARLVGELSADLVARGCRVTVLTTEPHYNRDLEAEARQPMARRWPVLLKSSEYSGVEVLHARMPRKGKSVALRLLAWGGYHAISSAAGLTLAGRPDVVLAVSPPLTIGLGAALLAAAHGVPFVYNAQELYPDLAVSLGLLRNRPLIAALLRLERFVYRRASVVTVIGASMARRLLEKGVPSEKVRVIPNFVDLDAARPGERRNAFSREHGLDDRLVVSYAGNLGLAQGLEVVISAARLLRHDPRVCFLIVGDGVLKDALRSSVCESGLTNCLFLPYQPHSRMRELYAASDLCLVPQAAATGNQAVPSKAYQIMAAERPVLALTEDGSDLGALVSSSGCGRVVPPDSPELLAAAVLDAVANRPAWRSMGVAGRHYAARHYSRRAVSEAYFDVLGGLARRVGAV